MLDGKRKGEGTHALELWVPWKSGAEKNIDEEGHGSPSDTGENEEADGVVEESGEWLEVVWEEHAAEAAEETHFYETIVGFVFAVGLCWVRR